MNDDIEKKENSTEPEIIWHYTNAAGFLHIMQPDSWFYGTHYRHLSDRQECIRAEEIVDELMKNKQELNGAYYLEKPEHSFSAYTYYIGCFSKTGKSKMLWENNEFCIGFDKKAIEKYIEFFTCRQQIAGKNKLALFGGDECQKLYDVIYNEPDFRSYVSGKIEEIMNHSKTIDIDPSQSLAALRYLAKTIYKQDSFKQEEEIRYVYYLDDFNKNIEKILGKPRIKLFPIDQLTIHLLGSIF